MFLPLQIELPGVPCHCDNCQYSETVDQSKHLIPKLFLSVFFFNRMINIEFWNRKSKKWQSQHCWEEALHELYAECSEKKRGQRFRQRQPEQVRKTWQKRYKPDAQPTSLLGRKKWRKPFTMPKLWTWMTDVGYRYILTKKRKVWSRVVS